MKFILATLLCIFSVNAFSNCEIQFNRTACPGKEVESYSKCDGAKICTKIANVTSEETCREAALAACSNSRIDITKSKIVTAKWDGNEILSPTSKADFCEDYVNRNSEYNKCQ